MDFIKLCILSILSYIIGSVNFALVITKFLNMSDIRKKGSGNAGMTNMLRVYGKKLAIITFIGDFLIGFIVAFIAGKFFNPFFDVIDPKYVAAFFTIFGHNYPIFFGFKGGKGIATALGSILAMNWMIAISIYIGLAPMVFIVKIVSIVSLCGTSLFPVLTLMFGIAQNGELSNNVISNFILSIFISMLVFLSHRDNMKRLSEGEEHSFVNKK